MTREQAALRLHLSAADIASVRKTGETYYATEYVALLNRANRRLGAKRGGTVSFSVLKDLH